jgi:RHS repeat-associated protein
MYYGSLQEDKLERTYRKHYSADGSMEIKLNTVTGATEFITYIEGDAYSAPIMLKSDGTTQNYLYLHRDYLGSIVAVTNQAANLVEKRLFDAWGNVLQVQDGAGNVLTKLTVTDRGYTGHEHLQGVALIHMNGRLYDPVVHRFLQPDNYIQDPSNTQNFNRYGYCYNNPFKYTDPSGEIVWLPIIIGAIIGAYSGGVIANGGQLNPAKWDYNLKTLGYIVGGAIVGGVTGGVANGIATSGVAFANTKAILVGSAMNGMGTHIYTGGKTDVVLSFGFASINFTKGEFGYLFKKGNSFMDNLGYGLGALANAADIMAGLKPGTVELRTENDPNFSKSVDASGNPINSKDIIGHSQLLDDKGVPIVDWGPTQQKTSTFGSVNGTNAYENGQAIPLSKMKSQPIMIKGVNATRIANFTPTGKYNLFVNNCVNMTSRALNLSGAFNIGIHPYFLQAQMYLRSIGARPMLFSYHLQN